MGHTGYVARVAQLAASTGWIVLPCTKLVETWISLLLTYIIGVDSIYNGAVM